MYPLLFEIGPLSVYTYGVMVATGIILAIFFIGPHAQKRGLPTDFLVDLIFWAVIWGLIGARVFYVLLNFQTFVKDPAEIFKIYKGGLVFHGGLIFGFAATVVLLRKKRLPFLKTLDLLAIYVPLAHAFGRLGCFLNGCCFGKFTYSDWGVIFPGHFVKVHPTQLYSAVLLLLIFVFLFVFEKNKKFHGQIFCFYLILYGAMRFLVEFLRTGSTVVIINLGVFQWISVILFCTGIFLYKYVQKQP